MFSIGLENGMEGKSAAWVLGHPGCFAYGPDADAALAAAPAAIAAYRDWIAAHIPDPWLDPGEIALEVEEVWNAYHINEQLERVPSGYEVNAWFLDDWKPLTREEVERGLLILEWSRQDLLHLIEHLDGPIWDYDPSGKDWSVGNVIRHVGNGEWWYLSKLGLEIVPRAERPDDPVERITLARTMLKKELPRLTGSTQVVGVDGEFWSPRKLLRRAAWHERDHIEQIRQLVRQFEQEQGTSV